MGSEAPHVLLWTDTSRRGTAPRERWERVPVVLGGGALGGAAGSAVLSPGCLAPGGAAGRRWPVAARTRARTLAHPRSSRDWCSLAAPGPGERPVVKSPAETELHLLSQTPLHPRTAAPLPLLVPELAARWPQGRGPAASTCTLRTRRRAGRPEPPGHSAASVRCGAGLGAAEWGWCALQGAFFTGEAGRGRAGTSGGQSRFVLLPPRGSPETFPCPATPSPRRDRPRRACPVWWGRPPRGGP